MLRTEFDYEQLRNQIISYINQKYPNFDYGNSSQLQQITDQIVYLQTYLNENIESQFQEVFYDSQMSPESIKSILSLYQYDRRYVIPSFGTVNLYFNLSDFIDHEITYVKLYINEMEFKSKIKQELQFRIVKPDNEPYYDLIENINESIIVVPIEVIQTNFQSQSYDISTHDEINIFEIVRPDNQEIILESIKGKFIDEFGNERKCYFQKDFIELYEKTQIEKFDGEVYLVIYSDLSKKYYLVQQNFFNKPRLNGRLHITYFYSFGPGGSPSINELDIQLVNMEMEIMTKKTGITKIKITELNEIFVKFSHDQFIRGKNIEEKDEWITNQKTNRTLGRQITYQDFVYWFESYIDQYYLSQYDYSYSITYNYSFFSNSVIIYLYFHSPISKTRKRYIMEKIKTFYEEIVPYGMFVLVKDQKTVKLQLKGSISFDINVTNVSKIYSELTKIFYNFNIQYKTKQIQSIEVSIYDIYREIYKNIDGLVDVNLHLLQNYIPVQTPILRIKSDSVAFFDDIRRFINMIKIIPVGNPIW